MPFFEKKAAKNGYNTTGVESSYIGYAHTDMESDLRLLPGFKTADQYDADPNEIGAFQNVRFFTSQTCVPYANAGASSSTLLATGASGTTAGNADVYPLIICAKDALHAVPLRSTGQNGFGNVKTTVLNEADKFDIHNKYIVIGATWYDVALITCQEWMAVGEFGVSRL
jgi:N4-gp56 family major capsid protein